MSLVEFERREIERLLGLLDARLQARGVPCSVYVVGGAAIAVTVLDARRTVDIDALVSDQVVLEEAHLLAEEERIPRSWLNDNARPWIPPRPPSATVPSTRPGLTIHWAPPEHLLAMKLVAMRPQDVPDIVALARQVGLGTDAAAYADLLERVYEGGDVLEQLLDVPDGGARAEALHRGSIATSGRTGTGLARGPAPVGDTRHQPDRSRDHASAADPDLLPARDPPRRDGNWRR